MLTVEVSVVDWGVSIVDYGYHNGELFLTMRVRFLDYEGAIP